MGMAQFDNFVTFVYNFAMRPLTLVLLLLLQYREPGDRRVGSWNRLDLRLSHRYAPEGLGGIAVSLSCDVFNLLNRQSALDRDGYVGYNADWDAWPENYATNFHYGYPTRWQDPRVYQFGLRVEF